jgi:hypothetical protein
MKYLKLERFTQWGQIYPLPTIRITHDKGLYGWYTIEVIWIKWGLSLNIIL